jgi:glycosyltransferase involved in cell wall biosynthesis
MHIAILSPSDRSFIINFLPGYNLNDLPPGYSGAPFIGILIAELLKQNHRVTAITTTVSQQNDYTVKQFHSGNFSWYVVPFRPHAFQMNGHKIGRILNLYRYEQKQLINVLKTVSPDIVHSHWSYEFTGAAVKANFPYLVTVHDNAFQILKYFRNAYRFGRLIMSEYILRKVRFASTVSPYMKSYVEHRCKFVKVIPNPVNIEYSALEIEQMITNRLTTIHKPKICMINNGWDRRKNGETGLLAFKHFLTKFPEAQLHLFGNGSSTNGIAHQLVQKLQIKNIEFHGNVSRNQLLKELKNSHLLLHPSFEESFGVVLIEALSFGVPAIGGITSGAVPWVLNDNRILVDITRAELISEKMCDVMKNADTYFAIAMQGYNNVLNRFSVHTIVNDYILYYQEILNSSN